MLSTGVRVRTQHHTKQRKISQSNQTATYNTHFCLTSALSICATAVASVYVVLLVSKVKKFTRSLHIIIIIVVVVVVSIIVLSTATSYVVIVTGAGKSVVNDRTRTRLFHSLVGCMQHVYKQVSNMHIYLYFMHLLRILIYKFIGDSDCVSHYV